MYESVVLTRDCDVVQIPDGNKMVLEKGTRVTLTQSLGSSFTLMSDYGWMVRLEGSDADAIGKEPPPDPANDPDAAGKSLEERVWDQLRQCYDPEIPVNIVDLGLVYRCEVRDPEGPAASAPAEKPASPDEEKASSTAASASLAVGVTDSAPPVGKSESMAASDPPSTSPPASASDGPRKRVEIDITLTAPGCGMGDFLVMDVKSRVRAIPDIGEVDVELVLEPAWDPSRMSEAAKLQLGLL